MVNGTPYTQTNLSEHVFERTFDVNMDSHELVWHRDHAHREVHVISGSGWQLQLDNQLPRMLMPGAHVHICAHVYHRLIKGDTDLVVRITEHESMHQEFDPHLPQMHHADHAH